MFKRKEMYFECACVCVRACVCMRVCVCVYMRTLMHACVRACVHA